MTYTQWFLEHGKKHQKIIQKLSHLSDNEIIDYFQFENMVKYEPDFCLLYKTNQKCHEIKNLNCYLCACPLFRFNEEGLAKKTPITIYSLCSIDAKKGAIYRVKDAQHHDCSACHIPHKKSYIQKNFSRDWFKIMSKVKSISSSKEEK